MGDLAEFLLEQIAKDEADARASAADAMAGWRWKHYPRDAYEEVQSLTLAHSKHVLAECEKNRRIITEVVPNVAALEQRVNDEWGSGDPYESADDHLLALLALPYADRPDYRKEWKP